MPKTYKSFVKEYAMGLQVPATSFMKPIGLKSGKPLRRKEDYDRDDELTGKKLFKPVKHMPKDSAGKLDTTEPKVKGSPLKKAKKSVAKPNARHSLMGMPSTKFQGLAFTQHVPNYTKA